MKKYHLMIAVILAILMGYITSQQKVFTDVDLQTTGQILKQSVLKVNQNVHQVTKLYDSGVFIGVITNKAYIDSKLNEVYSQRYKEKFPNAKINIGNDMYFVDEVSYYTYENIDDQIFAYIEDKNDFTLSAQVYEFSDINGIYDYIYVSNNSIFDQGLDKYLQYFANETEIALMKSNKETPPINAFGSRVTSIDIVQNITSKMAYTSPEQIYTTPEEVLEYLSYGKNAEKEYYTVVKYDTIEGVGSKNHGLTATQVMNINSDIIKSTEQLLEPGIKLNVTYFQSPIDVIVQKESVVEESVYPEAALLIEDPTLPKNEQEVIQQGVLGSQNALYDEKWINGVLVSGIKTSSVITRQPVQEIIKVGTYELPGVGTGIFRWPVDNPFISCRWLCYNNHRAIDVQNRYDRYGAVLAADRGVVEEVQYNSIGGNYIVINHGNGFKTYYGHLNQSAFFKVGDVVDKGQVIGQIGKTGVAYGPHVHFFITENGERRNPCEGYLAC